MRKYNDIAKQTGTRAGGVRMAAFRAGAVGCVGNVARFGYAPHTHLTPNR